MSLIDQNLNAMPESLRKAWVAYREGKIDSKKMREASMLCAINMAEEYRYKALPTAPAAINKFRAIANKADVDPKAVAALMEKNAPFYKQEESIREENYSNISWLKQLLGFAKSRNLPDKIQTRLLAVIETHEQSTVTL